MRANAPMYQKPIFWYPGICFEFILTNAVLANTLDSVKHILILRSTVQCYNYLCAKVKL